MNYFSRFSNLVGEIQDKELHYKDLTCDKTEALTAHLRIEDPCTATAWMMLVIKEGDKEIGLSEAETLNLKKYLDGVFTGEAKEEKRE